MGPWHHVTRSPHGQQSCHCSEGARWTLLSPQGSGKTMGHHHHSQCHEESWGSLVQLPTQKTDGKHQRKPSNACSLPSPPLFLARSHEYLVALALALPSPHLFLLPPGKVTPVLLGGGKTVHNMLCIRVHQLRPRLPQGVNDQVNKGDLEQGKKSRKGYNKKQAFRDIEYIVALFSLERT